MFKTIILGAALAAAALPAAVFASEGHDMGGGSHGGGHGSMHEAMHGSAAATAFGQSADPAAATRTITVTMGDMSFSPTALQVKVGEVVRFAITNSSGIDHDFTLGDAKTQATHRAEMAKMAEQGDTPHGHGDTANAVMVKAGESKVLAWRFTTAGTFEFDCNVPGHYESGMTGTLTVAP